MHDLRVILTRGAESRDITETLLELRWRLGMDQPFDTLAAPATGELLVDNRDQSASPELDAEGLLAPGTAVLIESAYDGWQPLFTGVVARVAPDMGEYSRRRTRIVIEGADAALARVVVRLPVMPHVRADEVIDALLNTPPLDAVPRSLDAGVSTFAYAGDQWGDGLSAEAAIRQLTDAERGRFYLTRDGTLTFRSRHFGLAEVSPDATFEADGETAAMVYGALVVNTIRIGLRPRALGMPDSTLWTLANAQRLRPGAQHTLIAPLRDSQGRRAGATSIIAPVATTDYTANSAADGSGTDMTASVSITVVALEGSAAKLRLSNSASSAAYLQPGATLRGTPLLGGQPATVEISDAESVANYGVQPLVLRLPLLDSIEAAHDLAAWELNKRAAPYGHVHTLTLSNRVRYANALPLTLFSRVRVVDPHTGHDQTYTVVGEAHTVTRGGLRHTIAFTLEPVPALAYWTIGVSLLGTDTRVAV